MENLYGKYGKLDLGSLSERFKVWKIELQFRFKGIINGVPSMS